MLSKNKILLSIVLILSLLYILSFTKSCTNTDKREVIKTALVNQKYLNQISQIELTKNDSKLTLKKADNFWTLHENESEITIPASTEKVEKCLKDLSSIRNMYKLSDKIHENNAFGLQNSDTFAIKYTFPEGIHTLYFGNQDFSQTSRFFMTDKNTVVYELDSSLDKYLSTNSLTWADPFLISQEVTGKISAQDIQSAKIISESRIQTIGDLEKLLDLRHGGIADFSIALPKNIESQINIELGNKSQINLEIYSTNLDSQYIVKSEYIRPDNSKYYCCTKISSWTYNKIKDITL